MDDHAPLDEKLSTTPMLTQDASQDHSDVNSKPALTNQATANKILLREDTYLGKFGGGCNGCSGVKITCVGVKQCSGALCWGKYSQKKFAWVLTCLVTLFLLSMVGTIIFCFTNVFYNSILSNLALRNNTKSYEMWKKPPLNPVTKIHLFNYTNIDAFSKGIDKKLKVVDTGPYVYSEEMERVDIKFNGDGTVSYREKRSYTYRPELSTGNQFDKVVVPNLPYITAVSLARDTYYFARMGLNGLLKSLDSKPFVTLPLHRYIWGFEDSLVNLAKPILAFKGEAPPVLGVLAMRNGTSRDVNTIETGENDINKLGLIRSVNQLTKMTHWGTDECNIIEATDGTMFPPYLVQDKKMIYIFNKDLCRRLQFEYKEDVEVWDGIKAYRYGHPDNIFDHPSQNPDNQCYCHMDSATCPQRGLFNTTPCAYGAPAFASFPHFYLGDSALVNAIDGLEPNPVLHVSHLDMHPKLGFPLAGVSRIQFNMQVRKAAGINDYLPDKIVLPIVWMEVTAVDPLPPSLKTMVYHATYTAAAAEMVLRWGCTFVFLTTSVALFFILRNKAQKRQKPCSMLKTDNIGNILKIGDTKLTNLS